MLTRNKKLKDYGIPAEDIEKLNTMLKDFPAKYGFRKGNRLHYYLDVKWWNVQI